MKKPRTHIKRNGPRTIDYGRAVGYLNSWGKSEKGAQVIGNPNSNHPLRFLGQNPEVDIEIYKRGDGLVGVLPYQRIVEVSGVVIDLVEQDIVSGISSARLEDILYVSREELKSKRENPKYGDYFLKS